MQGMHPEALSPWTEGCTGEAAYKLQRVDVPRT